jgi:hypothetical protein
MRIEEFPRYHLSWEEFFAIPFLPSRVLINYMDWSDEMVKLYGEQVELYVEPENSEQRAPRLSEIWYKRCGDDPYEWDYPKRNCSWFLFQPCRARWQQKKAFAFIYVPIIRVQARRRVMATQP